MTPIRTRATRRAFAWLTASLLACGGTAAGYESAWVGAQPDPALLGRLDSLRRSIGGKLLSPADKQDIRACDREKMLFLKQLRDSQAGYAQLDKAIAEAKMRGVDPGDPAVLSLLERKFTYEKSFDDKYMATQRGKQCAQGEARRRKTLDAALRKDKQYQSLLRQADEARGRPETL